MPRKRKPERRPRARPSANKIGVYMMLSPEAEELLHEQALKAGLTKSQFVEQAIYLKASAQ